jgi:hypothetical protein
MKSESQVEAALLKVKSLCIWRVLLNGPPNWSKHGRKEFSFSVREEKTGLTARSLVVSSELY